jgi:GGDEF domain-containing protein
VAEAGLAILGVVVGAGIVALVFHLRRKPAADVARELVAEAERQRLADLDRVVAQLKESFGSLSREALSTNSAEFLKLAGTRLAQETQKGRNRARVQAQADRHQFGKP